MLLDVPTGDWIDHTLVKRIWLVPHSPAVPARVYLYGPDDHVLVCIDFDDQVQARLWANAFARRINDAIAGHQTIDGAIERTALPLAYAT